MPKLSKLPRVGNKLHQWKEEPDYSFTHAKWQWEAGNDEMFMLNMYVDKCPFE